MGRDRTVWDFDILTVPGDKTGQSFKVRSKTGKVHYKTGKGHSEIEKDVLKQENDILKLEIWSFFLKFFNSFCPGTSQDRGVCPGIFAPALVLGQGDSGTRFFFVPGRRENRTFCFMETLHLFLASSSHFFHYLEQVTSYMCTVDSSLMHWLFKFVFVLKKIFFP